MTYQSVNASIVYVRKQSWKECCGSFLLNNWQHVIFLWTIVLLIFAVLIIFIGPESGHLRQTLLNNFVVSDAAVVGILAFTLAATPLGVALFAIGTIYKSLYNYLALLYRNTDFEDETESTTAWTVSKFLGSLAAKQVSLIGAIGVLSVTLTYYFIVATF
jgi:hypothetical protein